MIPITTFDGRRVAVFGLGTSGTATCRALLAGGATLAAWDDSPSARQAAARAGLPVVDLAGIAWNGLSALVLAPGVPLTHPHPHWSVEKARAAGVEVVGDIELFCRERARHAPAATFVAITGTNGKSTTTALAAHILRTAGRDVQMGGNIGRPILALEPAAPGRIHVIEMSSFQIDLTPSLAPSIGILLNLTPDHLDRHGTMANYAAVKERLAVQAKYPVVGADDDFCRAIGERLKTRGRVDMFSVRNRVPRGWFAYTTRLFSEAPWIGLPQPFADLAGSSTLRGTHNVQNALAGSIAALRAGAAIEDVAKGLATFAGLPHRLEDIGRVGRVLFVNDSKATNADSTEKALAAFERDIYWIAGGKPKEGGIAALTAYFPRVARAYLIGQAAEAFAATLADKVPAALCGTLDQAVAAAARDAAAGPAAEPVVLLSPACASYDQFQNFEQRGEVFRRLAAALPGFARRGEA
ncbi:MAG: UDP-N-acetylmuramoyl-L-alanine--D-glutamate ligase [Hyphomicrobiaceae bacterium]